MIKKISLIVAFCLLASACLRLPSASEIATPTPTPAQDVFVETEETKKFAEDFLKNLKVNIKGAAKRNGLAPLADSALPKESVEIRFYVFAAFYAPIYKGVPMQEGVIVLRRDGANWTAKATRNVMKPNPNGTEKKEKLNETLPPPASGWDSLWQNLQANGILETPKNREGEIKGDVTFYVVESKADGKYNIAYFHAPKEKSDNPEERRVATIFNLISKEFNATDFKAS